MALKITPRQPLVSNPSGSAVDPQTRTLAQWVMSLRQCLLRSQGAGCKALWKVLIYCKEPITKASQPGRIAYRVYLKEVRRVESASEN